MSPSGARGIPASILLVLLVAIGGCLGERIEVGDDHDAHHEASSPAASLPSDVVVEAHAGLADAELQLHPDPLVVRQGDVVEVRVENQGAAPHTWTLHEFGADSGVLDPGESAVVKFVASKAGSFEVMCDVAGHAAAGMVATLEVAA